MRRPVSAWEADPPSVDDPDHPWTKIDPKEYTPARITGLFMLADIKARQWYAAHPTRSRESCIIPNT